MLAGKLKGDQMRVWLKHKLTPKGDQKSRYFSLISLWTALIDTWIGKYSDVPSQTPQVRPKSEIYTPKRVETSRHFYMGIPPGDFS